MSENDQAPSGEETTALVEFTEATGDEVDDLKRMAIIMYQAGYFADGSRAGTPTQEVAKAIVKLMVGKELGLSPIAAMRGVYMTQEGSVGYSSNLIASAIKKSRRYDYRVLRSDAEECTIRFTDEGEAAGEATWTIADAERAGLLNKNNWKNYPQAMLFARAISAGARMFAPDLFDGPAYTPEELGDGTAPPEVTVVPVDAATGEVLEPETTQEQATRREVALENREAAEQAREGSSDIMERFDDAPKLGD